VGPSRVRFVTHLDVTSDQCAQAVGVVAGIAATAVGVMA
jgi:hypothetical protein